jgi:hypothetical protein
MSRVPMLAARWAVHRTQTAELLGDAVIDALSARLRRHLRPGPRDPSVIVSLPGPDGDFDRFSVGGLRSPRG